MSILIKGMEMPHKPVLLFICPDGTVKDPKESGYKAVELPPWCPIIDDTTTSEDAAMLMKNITEIITHLNSTVNKISMKLGVDADPRQEQQDPVEIQHVGYDADQLGRNK